MQTMLKLALHLMCNSEAKLDGRAESRELDGDSTFARAILIDLLRDPCSLISNDVSSRLSIGSCLRNEEYERRFVDTLRRLRLGHNALLI